MDDAALARSHHESHREFFRLLGSAGSPGSRWMQWPGVGASIAPATRERSLPNSVMYDEPEALAGAPVYERMGYRSLWRLGMYERREQA